nr:Chain C, SYNTHETIC HEXAPEPTIDE TKCVFM [synthetic construct]
TKCVFM